VNNARGGYAVICAQQLKTDSEEEETCVTVINVSHGAVYQIEQVEEQDEEQEPPDSPPPLPPPRDLHSPRSRTEILIGRESEVSLVQTVHVSPDLSVPSTTEASSIDSEIPRPVRTNDNMTVTQVNITQVSNY
jgi:hypothetical protein